MSAMVVPVQRTDHLEALPAGSPRESTRPPSPPRLVVMEEPQAFRLEIERVGTGDPPALMLWGEE